MDDHDFPNFGNAYPTMATTPGTESASWNPALRTDADAANVSPTTRDDDFFGRYAPATPEKSSVLPLPAYAGLGPSFTDVRYGNFDPDLDERRQSISVSHAVDIRTEAASPNEMDNMPRSIVEVTGPVTEHVHNAEEEEVPLAVEAEGVAHDRTEADIEDPVFVKDDSPNVQAQKLEEIPIETTIIPEVDEEPSGISDLAEQELLPAETNYEHQGEITAMEEAREESAEVSLMANEQAPPSVDQAPPETALTTEDNLYAIEPSLDAEPVPPRLDRSFTTNFTDVPAVKSELEGFPQQPPHQPEEWPAVADDRTFADLLDVQGDDAAVGSTTGNDQVDIADQWPTTQDDEATDDLTRPSIAEEPSKQALTDKVDMTADVTPAPIEVDMSAAWQAALDDDDLLDENAGLDPSSFFDEGDDDLLPDEDFLGTLSAQDDFLGPASTSTSGPRVAERPSGDRMQGGTSAMLLGSAHSRGGGTPDTGLFDIYRQEPAPPADQPTARQLQQSFADKAKGGYQSPYDLPMEVVKPRKRGTPHGNLSGTQNPPAPPPRSSSFHAQPSAAQTIHQSSQSQFHPAGPPSYPPFSRSNSVVAAAQTPSAPVSAKSTPRADEGFFADLPINTKARPRPSTSHTTQSYGPGFKASSVATPPPMPLSRSQTAAIPPPQSSAGQPTPSQPLYGGLRQPESLPLLPDVSTPQRTEPSPSVPMQNTRYSPNQHAPASQSRFSPAPPVPGSGGSRYSPAPTASSQQRQAGQYALKREVSNPAPLAQQVHAFAPRTSSPLAFQPDKMQSFQAEETEQERILEEPQLHTVPISQVRPLPDRAASSKYSPMRADLAAGTAPVPTPAPPPRSTTQSPGQAMKQPRTAMTALQSTDYRPSSTGLPATSQVAPLVSQPSRAMLPHRRQFSRDLSFAVPQDERAQDPLQRWRGNAIFKWNAGGAIVSSLPKQIPFYASGQGVPSLRCTAGNIKLEDVAGLLPMDALSSKFPGPLTARGKGRKKEVLIWMTGKIETLEKLQSDASLDPLLTTDESKRVEEKTLLWRLVKIFVEHDGNLDATPALDAELRAVLVPNLTQMSQLMDLQSPTSAVERSESVDKQVIGQIRQALLEGQRERAVRLAEDKKLWGHAMLIASTMGAETWREIIQAFVRSEVKSAGSEARSLAALYQVFASNNEDCVDELVPPSARAGFQMVSKTDGSAAGNPLEGLNQWQETLALIVGNRTPNDAQSLLALGKLLSGYDRVEAAHSCYLFARQLARHSGGDDAESHFVLLGGSQSSLGGDLDSIQLTEIYEWASSLSTTTSGNVYIPHLQSYKLVHAQNLATYGLKTKAQQYCDHITSAYTSTTRPSQYYHPTFTQAVADLSAFLSQAPQDGKAGGLFSKPAMNKVSSGAASWFTKFVSGDDDHDAATGDRPGKAGDSVGPFGGVSGSSSRTPSNADLYGAMMGGGMNAPAANGLNATPGVGASFSHDRPAPAQHPSRYAPQTPSSFSPGQSPRESNAFGLYNPSTGPAAPSFDYARPSSARPAPSRYAPTPSGDGLGLQPLAALARPEAGRTASDYAVPYGGLSTSRRGSAQEYGSQGSYEPTPSLAQEPSPYIRQEETATNNTASVTASPYLNGNGQASFTEPKISSPPASGYEPPSFNYGPPAESFTPEASFDEPSVSNFNPPADTLSAEETGYAPPTSSYGPPTEYQPYVPEPDSDDETPQRPKKQSAVDDDGFDDTEMDRRAAAQKKAEADRQADEAFRKAAEADAARDQNKGDGKKPGWFGGWFAGKEKGKDEIGKPIRAKLGEENSFYYDEDLKKWVNRKGGAETPVAPTGTPPPPKGPPSRAPSGTGGPPPPRVASSSALAGPPMSAGGASPSLAGFSSGPPSRAGTPASMRADSGIARPGPSSLGEGPPSAPPSRPATSMSTASSLDDLLAGPPGGSRKGGSTVRAKKKGGRYVDVMAK